MKTSTRLDYIDTIRAIGIIGMIIIHVLALHLGSTLSNTVWNYLHFVEVGFVFCSGVVYASQVINHKTMAYIPWLKKRFLRLYIPYILYIIAHITLWRLFPHLFQGLGLQWNPLFLFASITLLGGLGIGWLTLLFIQLTIISPLLWYGTQTKKRMLWTGIILSIFLLITTIFRLPTVYSRAYAWIGWSFVLFLSFLFTKQMYIHGENQIRKLSGIGMIGSLTVFVLTSFYLMLRHEAFTLTLRKYPPDLWYLSYGIGLTCLFLWLMDRFELLDKQSRFLQLVSLQGYTLFFIHFIVLDLFETNIHMPLIAETIVVIAVSVGISWGIERIQKVLHR